MKKLLILIVLLFNKNLCADILFQEDFDSGAINAADWVRYGATSYSTLSDPLGNGDYALTLTDGANGSAGIATVRYFNRGSDLRCTFRLWNSGSFSYSTVSGPWVLTNNPGSTGWQYPTLNWVVAGIGGQDSGDGANFGWMEGGGIWGWLPFESEFLNAWHTANSKANSLLVRVTLGNEFGAAMEWSHDDGATWEIVQGMSAPGGADIDTRQAPYYAGENYFGNCVVSDQQSICIGFAGGHNQATYIDDVLVENGGSSSGPSPTPSPTPDPAHNPLFEDRFDAIGLNTSKWRIEGESRYSVPFDHNSDGDRCLRLTGDANYANGIRSKQAFYRGNNLRVTFRLWNWHYYHFLYSTVGGPWVSAAQGSGPYPYLYQIEAGLGGQENGPSSGSNLRWVEGATSDWQWPALNSEFLESWWSANSKEYSVLMRVWLGDSTGCMAEYSIDNGNTWNPLKLADGTVIDTRGLPAGSSWHGVEVSSTDPVWLGFGGGYNMPTYIDDVVVEDDLHQADWPQLDPPPSPRPISTPFPTAQGLGLVSELVTLERIRPSGEWQHYDSVPDTLDLSKRAEYSINTLTESRVSGTTNVYHMLYFGTNPPQEANPAGYTNKHMRALPLLRAMCGSEQNMNVELEIMTSWMNSLKGTLETANAYAPNAAGLGLTMYNWYIRDKDPAWLDWLEECCRAIESSAVTVENRAFFPPDSGRDPDGYWYYSSYTPFIPYDPPEEPWCDQVGWEGTTKWVESFPLRTLVRYYLTAGDTRSLQVAEQFNNFLTQESMWDQIGQVDYSEFGYSPEYPGHEHGIWSGHGHGGLTGLHAILAYAVATNDADLKELVKLSYEHAKAVGMPQIGWIPVWFPRGAWNRVGYEYSVEACEPCAIGDMVVLLVMMNYAGIGDYWDDVDRIVRNNLVEQQISDVQKLQQISGSTDPVLAKYVGASVGAMRPSWGEALTWGCCSVNTAISWYYAWDGIIRYKEPTKEATINLLLNRASPWMDIMSWLPYQGKVELINKTARSARIRIPGWVNISQVSCSVNGVQIDPPRQQRYLEIDQLEADDRISLTFPISERTENAVLLGRQYTLTIRGATVVDIQPDANDLSGETTNWDSYTEKKYPLYQRSHMRTTNAPTKSVDWFISDTLYPLQSESADPDQGLHVESDLLMLY